MSGGEAIAILRRLAAGEPAEGDLGAVAERLADYLARASTGYSLDDAFGLSVGAGGEPWYARERREARDRELCGLVQRFAKPGTSVRERALWLQVLVKRYASDSWPRDRASGVMPAHYPGSEREYLFRAFMHCPAPTSDRQLRTILSGN